MSNTKLTPFKHKKEVPNNGADLMNGFYSSQNKPVNELTGLNFPRVSLSILLKVVISTNRDINECGLGATRINQTVKKKYENFFKVNGLQDCTIRV